MRTGAGAQVRPPKLAQQSLGPKLCPHLDVIALLQHGLDLLRIHEVVAAAEQHDAAWRQVLGPQVEVSPEEAAGEGRAHVQLMASHVDAALLDVVHDAAGNTRTDSECGEDAWGLMLITQSGDGRLPLLANAWLAACVGTGSSRTGRHAALGLSSPRHSLVQSLPGWYGVQEVAQQLWHEPAVTVADRSYTGV